MTPDLKELPAETLDRERCLLEGLACRLDRLAPSDLPADAQLHREEAKAVRALLSRLGKLQGLLDETRLSEAELEQGCKDLDLRIERLEAENGKKTAALKEIADPFGTVRADNLKSIARQALETTHEA